VLRDEAEAVMNPGESSAVGNAASGLVSMLGEDFAFADVVEAAAAAVAVAVAAVLALGTVDTGAEGTAVEVVELEDCISVDSAYTRSRSEEVEEWNGDAAWAQGSSLLSAQCFSTMGVIPFEVVEFHLVVAGTCRLPSEATASGHSVANGNMSSGDESAEASSDAVAVA
jgi:hypothetical protein